MREVKEVQVMAVFTLRLVFDDGSVRDVDVEPLLRGPMFAQVLSGPGLFAQVFVDHELGTIAWPNGADIDADVLQGGELPAWTVPAR